MFSRQAFTQKKRLDHLPGARVLIVSGRQHAELVPEGKIPTETLDEKTPRDFLAAYELLAQYAPCYLPWVLRMVNVLLPLHAAPGYSESGSSDFLPGVVGASVNTSALRLAELLVHEGTHQYFHNLTGLGRVDDGSDQELYYSPVVRTQRPIDRILIAYHAFANILLFYRLCLENGIPDSQRCEREIALSLAQLEMLARPLRQTRALTPIGQAMFLPLDERMRSLFP
jgi:HEXXH motif-containing protein